MARTVWQSLAIAVAASGLVGSVSAQTVLWANPTLPGDEMLPPTVAAPALPPVGDPADVWPQPNPHLQAHSQPPMSSQPVPAYAMPSYPVGGGPAALPQQLPPAMPAPALPSTESYATPTYPTPTYPSPTYPSPSPSIPTAPAFPSATYQTTVRQPSRTSGEPRDATPTPRPTWQIPSAAKVWNSAHRFRR